MNRIARSSSVPASVLPSRKALCLGVATALLFAGNVHAQDSEASTPTTTETQATSGEVKELGSVTVTARKRSERQIDVPIAMTAVTGEQIDAFGISNIAEIISMTPGAGSVDNGGGFTQVQIRGVSSSLGGNDNGYYLDEIPFTGVSVPWYPEARSWDIDRVEILKGPQGTLFGEGSMGGTVRILTRKPDFNEFGGAIEASASTTQGGSDGWGGKAVVNIPLIDDRLAARVAVTDEKLSGWTDDNTTGNKDINEQRVKTGRVKVRFAPTDQWTMDLAYWTYKSEAPGGGNGALDDLTTNSFYSNDDEWRTASFVSTYDFGGSELFYSFADAELDYANDGMLNPTTTYVSNINLQVRTQELRWSSTGDRTLDWTVGYYLREAERNDASQVGTAAPSSSSQTNDAYAVFGEVTVKLPDPRWALTGGIRYFSDDVDAISVSTTRVSTLNATFDSWNPRVSLSFKPANDTTLYASAARGFRSGQLQPISSILLAEANGVELPSTIDPDSITTYELGAKSLFLDGSLLVEGAVFYSDWEGVAVRVPITSTINGLTNSKGTENKGVEVNVVYTPSASLMLQVGGSIIDATYVADVPGTPLNKGTDVYNVPRNSFTASAAYSWDVAADLRGVVRTGVVYDSARETALTAGSPGDAITMLDARIGVESDNGWSAFLYGDNLTNEDGALNARTTLGVANRLRPRTYGVVFRYSF
ncbi:outer membrane receptor protein involved in Fe transport [Pseudoxanthomonas japonensis]|uniref:TonB-dependent receptor n=1 Tax=Pseudoxanthomonas japonensis TaxID=69284 RepID=UPI001A579F3C|nr:TonB-dependent receptor [Pseudoxanthomonas japonensis]MBL8256862.1 TonB-dependent receptor [Pseudoxanthomonas mexicana]MDR7068322.1 outer membrane receptor protein involved in Fe transport [Pseudoxanthomonas japonensis]